MEKIAIADYTYAERICKDFKIEHLAEYYDLYVTLL